MPPGERESRPSTSAVSVLILVCSVPACSWMASRGLSCCRSRPRAVSIAPWVLVTVVVMCSSGSSCSKAACQAFHCCCSANHAFLRFPRVRTFSCHECADPCKGIARPLDRRFELRQSARLRASGGLQRQELLGILVHAGADVPQAVAPPESRATPSAMALSRLARRPDTAVARGMSSASSGTLGGGAVAAAGDCATSLPGASKSVRSTIAWKRLWNEMFIRYPIIPIFCPRGSCRPRLSRAAPPLLSCP